MASGCTCCLAAVPEDARTSDVPRHLFELAITGICHQASQNYVDLYSWPSSFTMRLSAFLFGKPRSGCMSQNGHAHCACAPQHFQTRMHSKVLGRWLS